MKKIFCYIFIFLFQLNSFVFSVNIYVDNGSTEADANWSGNDGDPYTPGVSYLSGVVGVGYDQIEDALDAQTPGDDIFIREGNYIPEGRYGQSNLNSADFYINYSTASGTALDHSSIQSFPGEWAVLEGSVIMPVVLGHRNQDKDGSFRIHHYDIFRLGIDCNGYQSGRWGGIVINGYENRVRYNHIYECIADDGGPGALGGLVAYIPQDSQFMFNYIHDCGGSVDDNNAAPICVVSDYGFLHDTCTATPPTGEYHWFTDGSYDEVNTSKRNRFAYNKVDQDQSLLTDGFFKYKEQTHLTAWMEDDSNVVCSGGEITGGNLLANLDMTNSENGDEWDHNLAIGLNAWIGADFLQFHHNVITGALEIGPLRLHQPINPVVYNNTILSGRIQYSAATVNYFPDTIDGGDQPLVMSSYNNLLASPVQSNYYYEMTFIQNENTIVTAKTYPGYFNVERNYIYDRQSNVSSSNQIRISFTNYSLSAFDSMFGFTNHMKASSEGSDSLFSGATGANQYIARASHQVDTGVTIGNHGETINHPYLAGVQLPSSIGAVNDGENTDWFEWLYNLDQNVLRNIEDPLDNEPWNSGSSGNSGMTFSEHGTGTINCIGSGTITFQE